MVIFFANPFAIVDSNNVEHHYAKVSLINQKGVIEHD